MHRRDPRDTPAYTRAEAAFYLKQPASTVRRWVGKGGVIQVDGPLLSFNQLVELHVLGALRRVHGLKIEKIREAIAYVSQKMGVARPLLHAEFQTDGVDLFVERGGLVSASRQGQVPIVEVIRAYLKCVDWDDLNAPIRIFPGPSRGAVSIDPRIAFGKPTLHGTGVPTHIIAARFQGGEGLLSLAEDYDIPLPLVEEALRYEGKAA